MKHPGDFFLDPLFDFQLHAFGYLHNTFLGLGSKLGSPSSLAFSAIFDMAGGVMCSVVLYIYLHIGAFFLPGVPASQKSKGI